VKQKLWKVKEESSRDGSVEIVFWVKHLRKRFPEKWIFRINSDYKIDVRKEDLQQQQLGDHARIVNEKATS
jgi:hypothetical protein